VYPSAPLGRNVLLTVPLQWKAEGNLDWCSGRSSKPFGGCWSRWCVRFALSSAIPPHPSRPSQPSLAALRRGHTDSSSTTVLKRSSF